MGLIDNLYMYLSDYERDLFNVVSSEVGYDGNMSSVVHSELPILNQHLQYLKLKDSVESEKLLFGSYWMHYLSLSLALFVLTIHYLFGNRMGAQFHRTGQQQSKRGGN